MVTRKKSAAPTSGEEFGLKLLQSVRSEGAELRACHAGGAMRTLQEWEQGRRSPSAAAQALIRIARKHPKVVREALR